MGGIIDSRCLSSREELYRLLVYCKSDTVLADAVPINKPIAEKLLQIKPALRTIQLEKCFNEIIASLPDGAVVKDIDVLFSPDLKIDVLKVLIAANKVKPFSVIWPGRYADGKLFYSEESLPDYSVFDISDYDIYCVV